WLVINRQQAFAHGVRCRIESRSRPSRQDDALIRLGLMFSLFCHLVVHSPEQGLLAHKRLRIVRGDPLAIVSRGDFVYPCLIVKIPDNGLANTALKRFSRFPTLFVLNLTHVMCIPS